MAAKLWPYEQAEKALRRFGEQPRLLFETGYGPSGLPHIGTFCEVARTTWIRRAVEQLRPGHPTELYAFSDDMDGLRKVPLNLTDAQRTLLDDYIGRPLCDIPDPHECCASYADHNNGELRKMLDRYGFEYTFKSSKEQYRGGVFNDGLRAVLQNAEAIRNLILPTLTEEKRQGWSPFLPICESCGRVDSPVVENYFPERDMIGYRCEASRGGCGAQVEGLVLDGKTKVGWKVDWALRWFVFEVHYEMFGKDLIESANLSDQITRILGGTPPVHFVYEMFLDEQGSKISKSVGKGITVERWLRYASQESLALFLFRNPRKARRLSWEVIPRCADEHLDLLNRWYGAEKEESRPSELRFIHPELPREHPYRYDVTFAMLLNLVATVGTEDVDLVVQYVHSYHGKQPGGDDFLRALVAHAILYHREVLVPAATPPSFDETERRLLSAMVEFLDEPREEEEIQTRAFDVARELEMSPGNAFQALYRALSGQERGPRLGPFVKLVGQSAARDALVRAVSS